MAENKECWEVRRHYILRQTTVLLLHCERLNIYFFIVSLINTVFQLVYNYKAVQLIWIFFNVLEFVKWSVLYECSIISQHKTTGNCNTIKIECQKEKA